jgi:PPOX class probable F420-dependent enzyme
MADDPKLLDLIAANRHGILAVVKSDGFPHLSNVLYDWDADERILRITTRGDRVKGRVVQRDPHAALHVPGEHFWQFAVAEGVVTTSGVTTEPGDQAGRELLELHTALMGPRGDEDEFFATMVEDQRMVIQLHPTRLYGLVRDSPPG